MGATELRGVFPIVATPFDETGALDEASLRSLIQFELSAGVHGLTILGMAGEVAKLLDEERDRITRMVMDEVAGRLPVVVGATHGGSTYAAVEFCRRAEASGAAGVMVAPPFVSKPTQEQIFAHYQAVARAISIPIVVQDEPVATGLIMPTALIARLAREVPGCRYGKIEHVPTPTKMTEIARLAPDEVFGIFGGTFGLYYYEELKRGARGIMTGFAYPEALVEIWDRYQAGDDAGAAAAYERWLPPLLLEGQPVVGLSIRKHLLALRGAIRCEAVRQPGYVLDEATRDQVRRVLERVVVGH